jgi:hypothetical protein
MEPKKAKMRKHLCLPGLLKRSRHSFDRIQDTVSRKVTISLSDCLMSGLALFSLKYPSLLQFDNDFREGKRIKHNIQTLYGVRQVPSDTYLRERLDEVEPRYLQKTMDRVIAQLQRGKVLEQYRFLEDYCLVSLDGSGYFSSKEINCESCCEKKHQDGTVTYYHQMLAAVMVHPAYDTVFPLALEPIHKQDGRTKNDCEQNAAKRLLTNLRTCHPHLKMIVVLDGLYADGPTIKLLKALNFSFIITAKEADLKYLFEFYRAAKPQEIVISDDKKSQRYRFVNQLPLNDAHSDLEVNVLECFEKTKKEEKRFVWITDIALHHKRVEHIAKGGRARWKIENETFNTLKNQGYQFEHNFGHGNRHLSTVFAYLMFLAFLIDQVQQFCCKYFKAALKRWGSRIALWQKIRGMFLHYFVDCWEDLYTAIIDDFDGARLVDLLNTS